MEWKRWQAIIYNYGKKSNRSERYKMIVYFTNVILIGLEIWICRRLGGPQRRIENAFLCITFAQLSCLLCLRADSVGVDTQSNLQFLKELCSGGSLESMELGSRMIFRAAAFLGENETVCLTLFALPTVALYFRFIRKSSSDVYLSVLIFAMFMFWFLLFNIIRQTLAMAIALQALDPAMRKKRWKAVLIVFLASLVHTTAWPFLIVVFLLSFRVRIDMYYLLALSMICGCAMVAAPYAIRVAAVLMGYTEYIGTSFMDAGTLFHPVFYFLILCCIIILLDQKHINENDRMMIYMLSIGVLLYTISIRVQIVNRVTYYFTSAVMVLFPNLISYFTRIETKRTVKFCCYSFVTLYGLTLIMRNAQGILPYRFFWQ